MLVSTMVPEVWDWLQRRSSRAADWPAEALLEAKADTTISVVLPARNEAATVGEIVQTIRTDLVERVPLVDEIVVVDSRSTDDTAARAQAMGARVVRQDRVLSDLPTLSGKGEALWKGLAATDSDLVAFVDADLRGFTSQFVTGLLGPLLCENTIDYVKGFYHRPLTEGDRIVPDGGGRVTELVVRPMLNLYLPDLAGFIQPLAGEYAGRRHVLEQVPFVSGYGVEIGLLADLLGLVGLDALAQVDLGERVHRHQSDEDLGMMAAQIMLTLVDRLERNDKLVMTTNPRPLLAQFRRGHSGSGVDREIHVSDVSVPERPPLALLRQGGQLAGVLEGSR